MPPDRTADAELTRDPQYTVPNRLRCWRTASVSPLSRSRTRGGSRGTCRRPRHRRCRRSCEHLYAVHAAAISPPFRAPVDRHLSRARVAGAVPDAVAFRVLAAAGRGSDRDRGCAVFGRRRLPCLEGAAVRQRALARLCRACSGLSLCRDLASRLTDECGPVISVVASSSEGPVWVKPRG